MSGIVGIYNLDGRPVERSENQLMLDSITHRGRNGSGIWIKGPVALGCQLLRVTPESAKETQPLTHTSDTAVVFDGRLDNREEFLASLENSPGISKTSPDPAFVLAAYDTFGDKFAQHIIGDFAIGLFDPKTEKFLLARDAIGVRPLYYCSTRGTVLFASEIKAILAHPQVSSQPNDDYLAEFLFERLSGDDGDGSTFFSGIYTVPPGFLVIITPDGLLKRQYWDFDVTRCVRFKSFEEYTEGFRHYFEQAVRRRLRWSGLFEFLISCDGCSILGRSLNNATTEAFLNYLLGQALSFAIVKQGVEPLHSTVVTVDEGAVGFIGDCGYGKSSLGASFLQGGYPLLTDDLLILKGNNGCFDAYPGFPRIKLFPKIAKKLFGKKVNGVPMNNLTSKLILPLNRHQFTTTPTPLRSIYVLTPPSPVLQSRRVTIRRLTQRKAFLSLLKNTFNAKITEPERLKRQLAFFTQIVSKVPIKILSYPRTITSLPLVREAIINDLKKLDN